MRERRPLVALLLVLLWALPAQAHKLSYTEAWATFQADGSYTIDVFMDPRDVPPGGAEGNLDAVATYWNDNVDLLFDGEKAKASVRIPTDGEASADRRNLTVVRLHGQIPYDAAEFRWAGDEFAGTIVLNMRQQGDQAVVLQRLSPGQTSKPFPLKVAPQRPGWGAVTGTYLWLGFTHIIPKGLDHIAFVLGLFFLSDKLRPLFWQITAFTVAHSVTLGLASMGWVSVPATIVEPLIALSIAYVALENLWTDELKWWRPALVFAFGLLHGLGFAGVLGELGMEPQRFVTSLVSFNVGVELGQLAVVALAFAAVGHLREREWYRERVTIPASLLIGLLGLFWTVERVIADGGIFSS